MGISYIVRRTHKWDSKIKNYAPGNEILIVERDFQYDTTYTDKVKLDADEARYIGQELLKIAEEIDGKSKKDKTVAKIRKNTDKIIKAARDREDIGYG